MFINHKLKPMFVVNNANSIKRFIRYPYVLEGLCCLILFTFCVPKSKSNNPQATTTTTPPSTEVRYHTNFYFENSKSIDGYLKGNDFLVCMNKILLPLKSSGCSSYFVNSKEYPTTDILSKINNNNILTEGTTSSDHKFIYTNAIKKAINNNLSIVVTDGIYSVKGKNLAVVATEIEHEFKTALEKNEVETVILKLTSDFSGTYYCESCVNKLKINQQRPYYIFFFGSKEVIDKALADIKPSDFPGFKEEARFFVNNNNNVKYSVLTFGEELHGTVEPSDRHSKNEVHDIVAQRFSRGMFSSTPKQENYLQFAIAVDFSNYALSNSYLVDTCNFTIAPKEGYKIVKVLDVNNLGKRTKIFMDSKKLIGYTHIVVVRANTNLYGSVSISLENNLPTWIKETGTDNDCIIKGDSQKTYAFNQLMKGISDAYKKVSNDDNYLNLRLKIQP